MKKILVTGGNGFLGKHLCKRLLQEDNEVVILDRSKPSNQHIISYDIINPLPELDVSEIYNLAGTPSPAKYLRDPVHTIKTNTIGMINVLELAKITNAKVLQASTGEVYEESDFTNNRSCYRYGKRIAESICWDYHRQYGIEIRIARMFSSYGPGMKVDDGRVIPVFIQKALNNEDIILFGNQTRSFCYVDDMIEALISLMTWHYKEPLNIFHDTEISIYDLAMLIIELTNSRSQVICDKDIPDDSKQRNPNFNSAQEVFGWYPKTSLKEGLQKTITYFLGGK